MSGAEPDQRTVQAVLAVMARRVERKQRELRQADVSLRHAEQQAQVAEDSLVQARQDEKQQQQALLAAVMAGTGPASRLSTYQKGLCAAAQPVIAQQEALSDAQRSVTDCQQQRDQAKTDLRKVTVTLEKWTLLGESLRTDAAGHSFEG